MRVFYLMSKYSNFFIGIKRLIKSKFMVACKICCAEYVSIRKDLFAGFRLPVVYASASVFRDISCSYNSILNYLIRAFFIILLAPNFCYHYAPVKLLGHLIYVGRKKLRIMNSAVPIKKSYFFHMQTYTAALLLHRDDMLLSESRLDNTYPLSYSSTHLSGMNPFCGNQRALCS